MMVQALLFLPRLVVTPPARLVVVPPRSAAVRRFTAPGMQLGEDDSRPARGVEQLLGTLGTAELRADRDFVLAAVQQYGYAHQYASAELWSDRDFVLAAVQLDWRSLSYASVELQRDSAVLKAANHIFIGLDRLADRGQLKMLRTLASVKECGFQMNNCHPRQLRPCSVLPPHPREARRQQWRSTCGRLIRKR